MLNPVCSAVRPLRSNPIVFYFFPDEIVIDIITRLPAKTALRCRCVCKRWRDLTWSRDFLDLYVRRGAPMILFQTCSSKLYLFDNWWDRDVPAARPTTHEFGIYGPSDMQLPKKVVCHPNIYVPQSFDGIIVVQEHSRSFIVLNPIYGTDEYVWISLAKELVGSCIVEVFFHPSLKEYCTLWKIYEEVDYRMLNLGPNPCWRIIRNPCKDEDMILSSWPVYLDGYLYWKVIGNNHFKISEFDLKTEVYTDIPFLVPGETVECRNLVKIHNRLSFVDVYSIENTVLVIVWTLQDRVEKSWNSCSYNICLELSPDHLFLEAVAVWDGELFLKVDRNLYVCNLEMGTATRTSVFTNAKDEEDYLFLFCVPHAINLESLRNCKSKIFLNKKGLKPWRVVKDGFRSEYSPCYDDSDDEGNIPDTKKSIRYMHPKSDTRGVDE